MEMKFCPYCGKPLSEGCDCEYEIELSKRYASERDDELMQGIRYDGERQQDMIDLYRRER